MVYVSHVSCGLGQISLVKKHETIWKIRSMLDVEFKEHQEHINKSLANTIQVIMIKIYINLVSVTGSNSLGFDLKVLYSDLLDT